MSTTKVAITLDKEVVKELDRWVREGKYPNRSKAVQEAIRERMEHWCKTHLVKEASRLNPIEGKALAEGLFELVG